MRIKRPAIRATLRRLGCALAALLLLLSALPAGAAVTHGMVTGDKVLFRKSPTSSDYWDYLNTGWVAKVLGESQQNNYTWYKVEANIPVSLDRTYTGYIRGDFFRMLTAEEETAWLVNKPQPFTGAVPGQATAAPSTLTGDYALVTVAGANLRQAENGVAITALAERTVVRVLSAPAAGGDWYRVEAGEFTGYLHRDHLRVLSAQEAAALNTQSPPPAWTPAPGQTPLPGGTATGTLEITKSSTNLRREPGGVSIWQYPVGARLPYFGEPVFSGGFNWAKITDPKNGLTGYLRSDCYRIVGGAQPTAAPTPAPGTSTVSIRITLGGTNLRQTPGGSVLAVLDRNRVLPYYGTPTSFGGYDWVYAYDNISNQYGYVRSDCYAFVQATPAPAPVVTATPAPGPTAPAAGTLTLTKGGVNLRNAPAGLTIAQLDSGLVLSYTSFVQQAGYTWYLVSSPKGVGYVRSDVVRLNQTPGATATPVPVQTPAPGLMGYIVTIKSDINLRKTASSSALVLGRVGRGLVLGLTGPVQTAGGYNWYQVVSNGVSGFLRGDCVRQMTTDEVTEYLTSGQIPGLTPPADGGTPGSTGFVKTTMTSVNVRRSPSADAAVWGQIPAAGEVFPYLSTVTSLGRTWFKITYNGQEGYLLGSTARLLTAQEYLDYLATRPTPTPAPAPTPTPRPEDMSTTAVTRIEKVIVRAGAGMTKRVLTILYRQGSIVKLSGQTAQADGNTWYGVTAAGVRGWIRGDMLRVLTKAEEQALNQTGNPDSPQTATYRSLSLGSTGEDVTRLQNELVRRGLLQSAFVTGTYNDQTADAVRSFQGANGLVVDGIAGSNTQHKLYNTVPEDPYTPGGGSTVTPGLNPVEKVDWVAGDINAFWGRGEVATLTDVRTRISLRIKRWAGGSHVDGEPLTSADTAALCRVYGVASAQEILEKNLYQRRPVWITLKGRTFAASLYGVPHNYPAGDTIPGNDFNGQLCVHFINSRTHTSATVDTDHMRAIQDAYDAAPVRK